MSEFIYIFLSFLIVKFMFFARKYDYKITVFAGKTGSGKTMLATSYALDRIKKGGLVFSTYYIKGAYKLPFNFYNYNFPENSLLVIDEAQIGLDSRYYKKGLMPEEFLYSIIFDYAIKYGEDLDTSNEPFPTVSYKIDNKWIISLIQGQGSIITLEKIN